MVCKWFKICPLRKLEKEERISNKWRKEYCETEDNWKNCKRYQAEEKGQHHSDNMMPDGTYEKY